MTLRQDIDQLGLAFFTRLDQCLPRQYQIAIGMMNQRGQRIVIT